MQRENDVCSCAPPLKIKKPPFTWRFIYLGDPGAIRTRDRLIRSEMLYPAELRDL